MDNGRVATGVAGNDVVAPELQGTMLEPWATQRWATLIPRTSDEWTSLIRVCLLLALIPALWLGIIPASDPVLIPVVLVIGSYVILLAIGARWIPGLAHADLTVGIDLLVITLLVAISGGIHSPFRYLYYLAILAAAARLNTRQAVAASLATAGIMVFMWIRTADRVYLLSAPGFEIGVFVSGGFVLALVLGLLTQNQRWTTVMFHAQAKRTADLEALHQIGRKLRTAGTTEEVHSILVAEAMQAVTADHGMLVLPDHGRRTLTRVSVAGLPADFQGTTFPYEGSMTARVVESGATLRIDDHADKYSPDFDPQRSWYRTLGPAVYVPVQMDARVIAALILARRRDAGNQPFSDLHVRLLESIAETGGIAIHRASLHQNLEEAYIQVVLALAGAVDARDSYTADHSERISHWAEAVARAMGCDDQEVQDIRRAARLHDIGKIGIPDSILRKPMSLTDAEWDVMRRHPLIGQTILTSVERMRGVAKLVRQHQERWDGTGYPDGLQGEQILLGARILAVADAYSAIVDDRPYKPARSHEEAASELRRCAGTQFDPRVVEYFCQIARAS